MNHESIDAGDRILGYIGAGAFLFVVGLLLGVSQADVEPHASLYQREVPARVYGPTGALIFTGVIQSSAGDYVTVCKTSFLPALNKGCMVVKVGGSFAVVAGELDTKGRLK